MRSSREPKSWLGTVLMCNDITHPCIVTEGSAKLESPIFLSNSRFETFPELSVTTFIYLV